MLDAQPSFSVMLRMWCDVNVYSRRMLSNEDNGKRDVAAIPTDFDMCAPGAKSFIFVANANARAHERRRH